MRVTVGLPIADVRSFVTGPTHAEVPPWTQLRKGDSVRRTGGAVDSQGGRLLDVASRYCHARHLLRLPDSLSAIDLGSAGEPRRGFLCKGPGGLEAATRGRRLMMTEAPQMLRMELDLLRPRPIQLEPPLSAPGLAALVTSVLNLKVRIGLTHRRDPDLTRQAPDGRQLPRSSTLAHMGPSLASAFLLATTEPAALGTLTCPHWWVSAQSLLVTVEYTADEVASPPRNLSLGIDQGAGLSLAYYWAEEAHAHVLLVGRSSPRSDRQALQQLRRLVRSVHNEGDTVGHVLRQLEEGTLQLNRENPASHRLAEYLNRVTRALKQPERFGYCHLEFLALLYQAFGWAGPDHHNQLFDSLDNYQNALGSKLRDLGDQVRQSLSGNGNVQLSNIRDSTVDVTINISPPDARLEDLRRFAGPHSRRSEEVGTMDPVTLSLGGIVAGLIAKAVEKAGEKAGDAGWAVLGKLVGAVRRHFREQGTDDDRTALARVEDPPAGPKHLAALAQAIDRHVADDAAFATQLQGMIKEAGDHHLDVGSVVQSAWGKNIVQIGVASDSTITTTMGGGSTEGG